MAIVTVLVTNYIKSEIEKKIKDIIKGLIHMQTVGVAVGSRTQSSLLQLMQNGSPANNMPPRPVVEIALSSAQAKSMIDARMEEATVVACSGDIAGADAILKQLADELAQLVKSKFGTGALPPNAASTVAQKGSNAPLIDSGALRESIQGWVT